MDDRRQRAEQVLVEVLDDEAAADVAATLDEQQLAHVLAAGTWTDRAVRIGRLAQLVLTERMRRAQAAHEEALAQAIDEAQRCYARHAEIMQAERERIDQIDAPVSARDWPRSPQGSCSMLPR